MNYKKKKNIESMFYFHGKKITKTDIAVKGKDRL